MAINIINKPWNKYENYVSEQVNTIRVIGVGLPRTGTASLKIALEMLGFGPCHHMYEVIDKPNRLIKFIQAYDGEKIDFHELMKGFGSTVDLPAVDFYKDIHRAFPQAKLILTVRDSDEKWFESYQNTIGSVVQSKFVYFCYSIIGMLRLVNIFNKKFSSKWIREYGEIGPSMHDKHNKRVINENKDKDVLVFNVKEGWTPLCKYLEVDIPKDIPFPNINDTKNFQRTHLRIKLSGLFYWILLAVLMVVFAYVILQII